MNDILLKLDKVRERDKDVKIAGSVLASILILVFGIVIGAIALTIQHFAANSTVWWQDIFKDVAVDQIFKHFPVWFMFGLGVAINSSRPIKAAINDFLFFIGEEYISFACALLNKRLLNKALEGNFNLLL